MTALFMLKCFILIVYSASFYIIIVNYGIINNSIINYDGYDLCIYDRRCCGFCIINIAGISLLFIKMCLMKKYNILSLFMCETLCIIISRWMYSTILICSVQLYILTLMFNIGLIKNYNEIKKKKGHENRTIFVFVTLIVIFISGLSVSLNIIFMLYFTYGIYLIYRRDSFMRIFNCDQ